MEGIDRHSAADAFSTHDPHVLNSEWLNGFVIFFVIVLIAFRQVLISSLLALLLSQAYIMNFFV